MAIVNTYAPELIENGRRRYEDSDEPLSSIAVDFGVHPRTLRRYIERWGWTRRGARPPLTLSPVMRLLEEARHVPSPVRTTASCQADPVSLVAPFADIDPQPLEPVAAIDETLPAAFDTPELIERMLRAVGNELSTVEAMRAHQGGEPQAAADAERTARTLESLTRTLREVQRLRGAAAMPAGVDEDDMPRDIDEFRHELARRIDAFVKSRTDADAHADDDPAGGDPPRS